jgi:uncharacterized protein
MPGWSRYRSLRGLALALFAFLAIATSSWPSHAAVGALEIPKAPGQWVTDTAGMLSEATRTQLNARLQAYEGNSGHQVVVWIGRTLNGAPLDDFAVKTFEAWRIGRKGHDDGVLMLVLSQDRAIDIEVGYGLEDRVTDAISHRIIDEVMAPRLRAGDPNGALSAGVDAILTAIEGRPVPAASSQPTPTGTEPIAHLSPAATLLLGILGVLLLVLLVTHPSLAMYLLFTVFNGGSGFRGGGGFGSGGSSGGGGFSGGGGRSGGGGARGGW